MEIKETVNVIKANEMIGKKVIKVNETDTYLQIVLRHSNEDFVFTFNKDNKDGVKSNTKDK